jgi:hypothetical protein
MFVRLIFYFARFPGINFLLLLLGNCFIFPGRIHAQVVFEESNLPIVLIETYGQEIPDEPGIPADMTVLNRTDGSRNRISDTVYEYKGRIEIELRGYTSQYVPKKQYGLETQYTDESNFNVSLLGLPAENDWILNGPYSDKSLMRDVLAYQLSRELGQYAPRTRYCELMINGEYQGLYILIEKIKRGTERVNISEEETDSDESRDITGGYIYKIETNRNGSNELPGWKTAFGEIDMHWHDPKETDLSSAQADYSIGYFNDFESALFCDNFTDSAIGYKNFIDINSFIDYMIINEVAKNIDSYRLSTFLYKDCDDVNSKLIMGPVWDFNIAFGNAYYNEGYLTEDLEAPAYIWWQRFLQDSSFCRLLIDKWKFYRNNSLRTERIMNIIDSLAIVLEEAQTRNFKQWDILGTYIWPNSYIGATYRDEVLYLKDWLKNRISWMDDYFEHYFDLPALPDSTSLKIYPNPFTDFFVIEFELISESNVSLKIIDVTGQVQKVIFRDQQFEKGRNKLICYNGNAFKCNLPGGLYFLKMDVDNHTTFTKKIMRL